MKLKFIISLTLLLTFSVGTFAQGEKLQTVFIYNFTKHIEWPENMRSGDFIIGVIGNSPIIEELETLAKSRKVGSQPIMVKKYRTSDEIGSCHIIYVPTGRSGDIGSILNRIKGYSTLVITDKEGMASAGAAINFVVDGSKQKFELKKTNATKYGLKVSSDLERLAILIK
nr:YfiR family protein [Bacteroidota bacterium]